MLFQFTEKKIELLVPIFLILLMFSIPLSTTLKSIFLIGALISILSIRQYNQYIWSNYNTLWGYAALVFFLFIIIASMWSPAPSSMQWEVIDKYCKLIYLPILSAGFVNYKSRFWAINAYLFAMFLIAIICILKQYHFISGANAGEVVDNHIITGYMMALAAYISALFIFRSKNKSRFVYFGLMLLSSYQVCFINAGRTGYIVYCVLMVLIILQKFRLKSAAIGIILFSGLMVLIYTQSTTMQIRVNVLIQEGKFIQQDNLNTSLGLRIQFHNYAKSLFKEHPLTGMGTGSFKYRYSQDHPVVHWGPNLNEPHSQYWMTLAEQGLIGLMLLLFFLLSLFITSFQLTETRPVLLGILLSFCMCSFTDTILCFSPIGYLLILLSALCFGELIEKKILSQKSYSNKAPILA